MAAVMVFAVWAPPGMVAQPLSGGTQGNPDRGVYFRTPENDAANCLYVQLRLLGYSESYEVFRQKLPDHPQSLSLASLASLGRKLGFRLVAVKMTVSELARTGTPVIVHFEERGIGSGQFLLVLGMDKAQTIVALIEGGFVTYAQMPRERFRRHWTGYALMAQPPTTWGLWMCRGTAALVVVGGLGWLAYRIGGFWNARNRV